MSTQNSEDENLILPHDLQQALEQQMHEHNNMQMASFDGLSPQQMGFLQYELLNSESGGPLVINHLSEEYLKQCPLLMQLRFLMEKMRDGKTLPLTKTGALSTTLVKELYALGHLKNYFVENGLAKVYKESEIIEIQITRMLLEISSLVKKRNNKLSLTKKGVKYLDDGNFILREILNVLLYKFNWAYYDGYGSEAIGQVMSGYSLYLLKKYGDQERPTSFYAEKYFQAFPDLGHTEKDFRCYGVRTFKRYFKYMGFVNPSEENGILNLPNVTKTAFMDQLFQING